MQQNNSDTSVLISLRELVSLEDERIREEEAEREAALRAAEATAKAEAERLRQAEEQRRVEEAQAQLARARAEREHAAQIEAMKLATIERARVEAAAKAERELAVAQQKHDESIAALDAKKRSGRVRAGAAIALVAALLGGGLFAAAELTDTSDAQARHRAEVARLAAENAKLSRDRLNALDRFRDRIDAQTDGLTTRTEGLDAAKLAVDKARTKIGAEPQDSDIAAYETALDDLAAELVQAHRLSRVAELEDVHGELDAQLDSVRRPSPALTKVAADANAAKQRVAGGTPEETHIAAYRTALESYKRELDAAPVARRGGPISIPSKQPIEKVDSSTTCHPKDPMCFKLPGLN